MNLDDIDKQMLFYGKMKEILSRAPMNVTEAVFLKYIELRRTQEVADYLNRCGLRTEGARGSRRYISTDITEILDRPEAVELVDPTIYRLVKRMQKSGRLLQRHVIGLMDEGQ